MSGIENYQKLLTDCKIHLKQALLNVMHNEIGDPTVTRIPSDPEELYNYLKGKKKKIEGNLNANQKAILFPTDTQRVDSQKFDVTLTRLLIREFCDIKNAKGNKGEPDDNDTTLWAYVYRAAVMRNEIFHEGNIIEYDEETYTDLWGKMKNILDGLKYKGDTRVFLQHLKDYKDYSSENTSEEFHIERYFSVKEDKNKPMYIYEQEVWSTVLKEKDRVIIHGEAGIGKTETARKIKRDWSVGNILFGYHLLYFKSKTMNQQITYRCCEAPYFFSEMGEGRGKSYENLLYYDCVTRPIWNLFILVDGVDEFPIKNLLIKEDVDKLETKVSNNEKITAAETIYAIYYGFLFPNAKICLLGRNGEFQRLKEVEDERENSIFNTSKRETADLMLLKFNEENIKDFTCFKICNGKHTGACQEIYEKLKNIDLCKVPTNLNSYLKLPNKDIGRITRTKILIATLHNRLNKHISKRMNKTSKSFREIREERIFKEYLECIRALAEMSFNALLKGVVTVEVVTGESGYLEDIHNHIKVKRTCLEELDFFYIRDDVCDFKLEPYHTLNIEFLSACYLFSQPAKWNLISKLKLDNEAVIIAFIAGLHAGDRSTSDFVRNVFNTSDYSLAKFFDWLYDKRCWNGSYNFLMPNQQMSPPIYILEKISHEVEIPQTLISSTIIAYSLFDPNLYNFKYVFKHSFFTKVSDNLDLDSFLDRFPKYNFIITIEQAKMDEENFRFIKKYKENNRVSFRTFQMRFKEAFKSLFDLELSLHGIRVEKNLDSSSNTKLLSSLSSPSPNIKCKILYIMDITKFNEKQIKQLFNICLDGNVEAISLCYEMLTTKQIKILKEMENRNTNKLINLQIGDSDFRDVLDLPNLGSRNLFLIGMKYVNDDTLREFRKHVIPGPSSKLSKSKVLPSIHGLYVKNDNLQENDTLMCLHLGGVNFSNVTPEVFASIFRLIPSLVCTDDDDDIPSTHWKCLSEAKGCQIQELRIWYPDLENYAHFLNIKSKMIQFVCGSKDELKELLDYIVGSQKVQLNKKIKVFHVSVYRLYLEKYEEVTLFSRETIDDYKANYVLDNSLIDVVQQTYYEGEKSDNYWCCELSLPFQKKVDLSVISCCDDNENSVKEIEDELSAIPKTDDLENVDSLNDNESTNEETDNSEIESSPGSNESSNEVTEDELNGTVEVKDTDSIDNRIPNLNDGNCSILRKCCCCFSKL